MKKGMNQFLKDEMLKESLKLENWIERQENLKGIRAPRSIDRGLIDKIESYEKKKAREKNLKKKKRHKLFIVSFMLTYCLFMFHISKKIKN